MNQESHERNDQTARQRRSDYGDGDQRGGCGVRDSGNRNPEGSGSAWPGAHRPDYNRAAGYSRHGDLYAGPPRSAESQGHMAAERTDWHAGGPTIPYGTNRGYGYEGHYAGMMGIGGFQAGLDFDRADYATSAGMMPEEMRPGRPPQGYQRSDERIADDICNRIVHGGIDAGHVHIEVNNGEVTLSGTVRNRQDKHRIDDIAESTLGVKEVTNRIKTEGGWRNWFS